MLGKYVGHGQAESIRLVRVPGDWGDYVVGGDDWGMNGQWPVVNNEPSSVGLASRCQFQ